jgi:hypothetical protein
VFLDRWYLAPGQSWVTKLEQTLTSCGAVAVVLGPHGLGHWQQRERDLALDRQARQPGFSVIPVLLPGAEPALDFLGLNTWVDLRSGLLDRLQLEVLARSIRGEPPGPNLKEQITATLAAICPYRGLLPFREEDASFFCGRQAFTNTLVQALGRCNLMVIVGTSDSGKPSVVRAGLVPQLRQRCNGGSVWKIVTMVPGEHPLRNLAAAVMPLLKPDLDIIERRTGGDRLVNNWGEAMRGGGRGE